MPFDDGFGSDEDKATSPIRPDLCQPNSEEAVAYSQAGPVYRSLQNDQLMTKREVLSGETGAR